MSVELVDDNGPLTTASRVYGRISPAGQPKSFSPNLIWDFIRTSADVRYALAADLSSLDDYVSAFTLQKGASDNTIWEGQGLRATGFADGVASDDLATVGQITALSSALTIGTTVVNNATDGRVLYNNNGILGQYTLSGTGKVLMDTNPVVASALTLGTQQTTQGSLVLANTAAGAYPVTLLASNSTSAAWTLTLPTSAGSNGQALTTNGSGVTTWTSIVTSPGGSSGQFQYNNSSAFGGANLYYESANVLAQRNGATSQAYYVYNSYTDGSNYERSFINWVGNVGYFGVDAGGSGTRRGMGLAGASITFLVGSGSSSAVWQINTSGHILAASDNTYDIGASGATRPRNLYVAGTGIFGGLLTTVATALGGAGFNLPHGTAPSSPTNGDVWTTTAGLYARINGATVGPYVGAAAGSTTQVQYNNAGAFAGDSGFTYSSTNKAVTLGGATLTASAPVLDLTQTWNSSGVTFTGVKLNVTDTASAAATKLLDLQQAGTSIFNVRRGFISSAKTDRTVLGISRFSYVIRDSAGGFTGWGTDENSTIGVTISDTAVNLVSGGQLTWCNNTTNVPAGSTDLILARDAANTLAQRNSTNAQRFNLYNTYTDASNYEQLSIYFTANIGVVGTGALGTGTQRRLILAGGDLMLQASGTNAWNVSSSGHLLAVTDNTYDIGASGATRPRNVYVASNITAGTTVSANTIEARTYLQFGTGGASGYVQAASNGVFTLYNAAGTDFGRLQFGGTTSSFPALKRSSTDIQVRLADDSGYAGLQLGATSAALKVGTHSAIGAETVTGYITIKDSGGTDRKIAVVS